MTRETIDRIVSWLEKTEIPTVDLTGGAPEMIPDFHYLVESLKALEAPRHIIDRCNLTILLQPGNEDLAGFLARNNIEIVASLPCYSAQNVDAQRGKGVFDQSIQALQLLNSIGYGIHPELPLHLAYNPVGAKLPGPQAELEADYKVALHKHFGIVFNRLFTITNMPIARFASFLRNTGQYEKYQQLLLASFNPNAVSGLMCRTTINIGWGGEVYDCDFNQMLQMQWQENGRPVYLWDLDPQLVESRQILSGNHCFGCTAGAGSSCGGALT
jgi:radical SAM/Cys-rich protein